MISGNRLRRFGLNPTKTTFKTLIDRLKEVDDPKIRRSVAALEKKAYKKNALHKRVPTEE